MRFQRNTHPLTVALFILLVAFASTGHVAYGQADNPGTRTFRIMKLNTPTISIGGQAMKTGQTFSGTKNINWADDNQLMEVKDVSDGRLYKFSKKVMESKGSALSIADFFLRTNKASSRDVTQSGFKFSKSSKASQFPERRLALVMGNSNYFNLSYLRNAQKDASDIADMLLGLGFDVLEAYETNYDDMRTVLNKFSGLGKDYDAVLFYFAGHGLQDDGKNYLIPINAELEFRSELRDMLQADDVLQRVAATGAPTQFIFIDACRNAKNSWSRDLTEGLARMEGGPGAVIVFSTESGKVALDGDGDNSPFAAALLHNLASPATSFSETMNGVVRETYQSTGQRQYPLIVGTPLTDFNFNPAPKQSASNNNSPIQMASNQDQSQQANKTANKTSKDTTVSSSENKTEPKSTPHNNTEVPDTNKKQEQPSNQNIKEKSPTTITVLNGEYVKYKEPLVGCELIIKRNGNVIFHMMSDIDGRFSIPDLKQYDVLRISYVGFNTSEITIDAIEIPSSFEFRLKPGKSKKVNKTTYRNVNEWIKKIPGFL